MSGPRDGLRGVGRSAGARRVLPVVVGLALVAGAVWVVVQRRGAIGDGFTHAAGSPWWALLLVVLFPLLSVLTTSCSFWLLTRRFGAVGFGEMTALISGATLLNYLPLKPGMIGRLAYHKRVNGIPLRSSVRVLVEAVSLSIGSAAVLLGIGVLLGLARKESVSGWGIDAVVLLAPAIVLSVAAYVVRAGRWSGLLAAAGVRYADMLIWTGRYALLLWMLGTPVRIEFAVVIASLSQIAMLAPTGGGGIGVREWTVGLVGGGLGASLETALVADLVNRAAEFLVAVPIGLIGMAVVRRNLAAHEPHANTGDATPTGSPAEGSH